MSSDFLTLCEQAERSSETVLSSLSQIEAALSEVQAKLAGLPFFVRGFVSSEVKRGTGQDLGAWLQAVSALKATLGEARTAVGRSRAAGAVGVGDRSTIAQAGERVAAERPRLEALVAYMRQAPAKLQSVPGGMIKADQREEILGAIDRQTQALRAVIAAMPELAGSLDKLSGRAA